MAAKMPVIDVTAMTELALKKYELVASILGNLANNQRRQSKQTKTVEGVEKQDGQSQLTEFVNAKIPSNHHVHHEVGRSNHEIRRQH